MENNIKTIKTSDVELRPIRPIVLPDGFIVRLQKVKMILHEVETTSLEVAIGNFMRDFDPEAELETWEAMAYIYQKETISNPDLTLAEKKYLKRF